MMVFQKEFIGRAIGNIATDAAAATRVQMARDAYEDELTNAWRSKAPRTDNGGAADTENVLDAEFDNTELDDSDLVNRVRYL